MTSDGRRADVLDLASSLLSLPLRERAFVCASFHFASGRCAALHFGDLLLFCPFLLIIVLIPWMLVVVLVVN
jgi:hypothetical protein